MRRRNWKKLIILVVVLLMTSAQFIRGQRTIVKGQKRAPKGVTLVFCNEKDTLRDQIVGRASMNGRTYLTGHYLLSDVKGRFNFSLRSSNNFNVLVRRKNSRGKWSSVNTSTNRAVLRRPAGIQPYYYWNFLRLTQSGNAREHNEIGVIITPFVRNQRVTGSWHTYGCRTTRPGSVPRITAGCKWSNGGGGVFGTGRVCYCNGKASPAKNCSKKP